MRKLIQSIKSLKLKQILTVFLAGSFLVISTACSDGNVAQAGGKAYTDNAKRAMSDTYDDYDANQSFKGGMNGYNDDRRYDGDTAAKVKALVDSAESRQEDNLGDYVKQVGDRTTNKIDEYSDKVPQALEDRRQEAAKDIKKRTKTLQKNLDNAPDEARKVLEGAVDTAQDAVEDATKATKKTTKQIKDNFEDLT